MVILVNVKNKSRKLYYNNNMTIITKTIIMIRKMVVLMLLVLYYYYNSSKQIRLSVQVIQSECSTCRPESVSFGFVCEASSH